MMQSHEATSGHAILHDRIEERVRKESQEIINDLLAALRKINEQPYNTILVRDTSKVALLKHDKQ